MGTRNENGKRNTGILEGRVNLLTMATLLKMFDTNGVVVNSKSELLNEIMETLLKSGIDSGLVTPITDLEEAMAVMERLATNRDRRVMGNLYKAIRVQNETPAVSYSDVLEGVRKFNPELAEQIERANMVKAEHIDETPTLSKEAQEVPDLMSMFEKKGE